ncbi:MAG: DUF805 domain-containing protein [Alphaproteobacteria bacterium]|nr:DUF805 domain-containing protein [Alphaproteobacteria bacterium]
MSLVQNAFSFEGRIGRPTYVLYGLLTLVIGALLIGLGGSAVETVAGHAAGLTFAILAGLATLWIGLSLTIRRLHDVGRSGIHSAWIVPLLLADGVVPFAVTSSMQQRFLVTMALSAVILVVLFAVLLRRGTEGPNRFGSPPGVLVG